MILRLRPRCERLRMILAIRLSFTRNDHCLPLLRVKTETHLASLDRSMPVLQCRQAVAIIFPRVVIISNAMWSLKGVLQSPALSRVAAPAAPYVLPPSPEWQEVRRRTERRPSLRGNRGPGQPREQPYETAPPPRSAGSPARKPAPLTPPIGSAAPSDNPFAVSATMSIRRW